MHRIFGNAPTLTTSILSTADVWAQGNLNKGQGGLDARTGNNIRYDSPEPARLHGALQASTRDDSGNTTQTPFGGDNGDHTSALRHAWVLGGNVIYSNGPLQAAGSYESNQQGASIPELPTATVRTQRQRLRLHRHRRVRLRHHHVRASVFVSRGVFEHTHVRHPEHGRPETRFLGRFRHDSGRWRQDLRVLRPSRATARAARRTANRSATSCTARTRARKQWEITYSYNLSPRTLLYAGYVKLDNDKYNPTTFNINSYAISTCACGSDCSSGRPGGAVLGFVHLF